MTKPLILTDGRVVQGEETVNGTSDHGGLTGLGDDDHTQYVLVDGTRAMTGNLTVPSVNMSGHITGYADSPSNNDVLTWVTANGRFEAAAPAGGTSDHGSLTGLADDDHTQYVTVDGTRAITTNESVGVVLIDTGNNTIDTTNCGSSVIISGRNNTLNAVSSAILSGNTNNIANASLNSVIAAGYSNTLTNSNSLVLGGKSNTNNGSESLILGGQLNNLSGSGSVLLGGYNNNLSGNYSSILGGYENTVNSSYSTAQGVNTLTSFWGQRTQGGGRFVEDGDAQYFEVTQFIQTESNVAADMTMDGVDSANSSHKLVMPANSIWQIRVWIVGQINFANIGAYYAIHAAIIRDGAAGPSHVSGSPSVATLGEDDASFNCSLQIRAGNIIAVSVVGPATVAAPRIYNWVSRWEILQVKVQD